MSPLSPLTISPLKNNSNKKKNTFHQTSPPLLTFNHIDPLIGLVNQIQMIRDQTSVPPLCFHGSVWFRVRPVGEAVDRPLRLFLPLPITQNQLILLVRGQQTKTLVKAPGVPVGLIQDLTDKKKKTEEEV